MLQKPSAKSKSRDHVHHLQRRLNLWKEGRFDELFRKGKGIQQRLESSKKPPSNQQIERIFSRLMVQGKVNAALRYLSDNTNGGILAMDEIVEGSNGQTAMNVLKEKHPASQPTSNSALIQGPVNDIPAVIFDQIDGDAIKRAALRTQGSSGPSGMDSNAWRRPCCSFGCQSAELCNSLASLAKRLCTEFVDPRGLQAFVACRLIPLNKCPGLRPIGIGETFRRIISKSIAAVVKDDICQCAGSLKVCAGQEGGSEAAIHAMRSIFQADESDCVLLVDAKNAFNTLNRNATLHNSRIICPALSTILINTYRVAINMYVIGGETIQSVEGTTQGDPLAMAMYAIGTVPLISSLAGICKQVWFADDATGAGTIN